MLLNLNNSRYQLLSFVSDHAHYRIDVTFSSVCPLIDDKFCHNSVSSLGEFRVI